MREAVFIAPFTIKSMEEEFHDKINKSTRLGSNIARFLAVYKWNNRIGFIGGGVDKSDEENKNEHYSTMGELKENLLREIEEETGLKMKEYMREYINEFDYFYDDIEHDNNPLRVHCFYHKFDFDELSKILDIVDIDKTEITGKLLINYSKDNDTSHAKVNYHNFLVMSEIEKIMNIYTEKMNTLK